MADDPSASRLIYDSYFHETDRISQRTDWFLIFHAILLEAFFAARELAPRTVVGVLGAVSAFLWLAVGVRATWLLRQLGDSMSHKYLMPVTGPVHTAIFASRVDGLKDAWYRWARPAPAFSEIIPGATCAAWLTLLGLETAPWRWPLLAAVTACAAGAFGTSCRDRKPLETRLINQVAKAAGVRGVV